MGIYPAGARALEGEDNEEIRYAGGLHPVISAAIYLAIYAFSPIVKGLPFIMQSVLILPLVLTTTRVFPDALGLGSSRSHVIMSLVPSIFASIAISVSSAYRRPQFSSFLSYQFSAVGDTVNFMAKEPAF